MHILSGHIYMSDMQKLCGLNETASLEFDRAARAGLAFELV